MAEFVATATLWLFVINLGIAFGAGLYETRIMIPQWLNGSPESGYRWNPELARQSNTGLRFWVYVTTLPLTLLTLAGLVTAWESPFEVRYWWLGAVTAGLVDRILTFAYFIPTMLALMQNDAVPQSEAVGKASQWVRMGYVRHAATLIAWLAALKALSKHG